jgi:hypothetical protein
MGVSNGDEDGYGVEGDGSGGNSPSRQGAGTETSVLQNWSSMAAALWNFSWMDANPFRVFASEGIYKWKGDVRGVMSQRTSWETPRGRYNEHISKYSLSKKPRFNRPVGERNHF